jgi:two-component system, sensor histidine kinase
MIPSALTPDEERVLVFAPVGCDAAIAVRILNEVNIDAHSCKDMDELCDEMQKGVGALLITEEVLWDPKLPQLVSLFDNQPSWSAIPIVIAANIDESLYERAPVLRKLENYKVTYLTRPVVVVSLASTLRSALSARHRQYQVRDLMVNLHTELRLRDEFLATLSHELRNPLSAVRNAVQLMNQSRIDDEALARSRDIIDRQTRDLGRLLDDLLDVSRVTQGKITLDLEVLSLRELLEEIVRDHEATMSEKRHLVLKLPEDELLVRGDRLRMKQIFVNLLNNAEKFSEDDCEIVVRASVTRSQIAISVKDEGIGIERDMLDTVFHLFSQATRSTRDTRGGLGIGLTVVQSLVQMHQGRITVASEGPGKGAEFTVYLPRVRQPAGGQRLGAAPAARKRRRRRVLVIEDDPDGAETLRALLEADGHEVSVCLDGRSGLAQARSMQPDVAILDIGLPDCTGYEIARLLHADEGFENTTFVALTGYGSEKDRQRAREAGFDHHLTKPIDFATLRALLQDGLDRKSAGGAGRQSQQTVRAGQPLHR